MDKIDHLYTYSTNKAYRFYYDKYLNKLTEKTSIRELKEFFNSVENAEEYRAVKQRVLELIEELEKEYRRIK